MKYYENYRSQLIFIQWILLGVALLKNRIYLEFIK